ncbi:heparinase II/III domain-containing protein [Nesterenkonia lutea]|uniref:Heparin-sulfate lyase N-terminal domain-containing protein n=1 Tax=Nesterenkonia lutea TaxID=272919 RepID=A0ABR9JC95_9MICC|nr:heparinase II/III family protein [Nesterenkonia lutea]MBE1523410.1 hypothetical protein [Nesterenkonia lutea]
MREKSVCHLSGVSIRDAGRWAAALKNEPADDLTQYFKSGSQDVREVIDFGWKFEDFNVVPISTETAWREVAPDDRTWNFKLHTWEFLDPAVREYLSSGQQHYLEWAVDVAVSWTNAVLPADEPGFMEWYDMALSLRSPRLAGLLVLASRAGFRAEALRPLFALALSHRDTHEADESFVSRNNHGFYAAMGQIVLARSMLCLPGMTSLHLQGMKRMEGMAQQQFLPDGGHAEHSPDYHRMLLGSFQQATDQGFVTSPDVLRRVERASEALGWFVQPNGKILQFGDSPARKVTSAKSTAKSERTKFIVTNGRQGESNPDELFVLPDTGYAIIRSPQPDSVDQLDSSSYLALSAGFHSRAHKHCDDLSLVWWHRGIEVLVDGGRYGYGPQLPKSSPLRKEGYYYDSVERQYVESVFAHNTVALDGQNHDRRRAPYGSALCRAVREGSRFVMEAFVDHGAWSHRRTIELRVGERAGLVVTDLVDAEDGGEHEYNITWNFDGALDLEARRNGEIELGHQGERLMTMSSRTAPIEFEVVKGRENPLRGWRSREDRVLEPAWSVLGKGSFVDQTTIVTEFNAAES